MYGADKTSEVMVFDPSQVRATWAKFDPAKKYSSNLLAGLAAAPIALGALLEEEN
jgi:hypothetical protein